MEISIHGPFDDTRLQLQKNYPSWVENYPTWQHCLYCMNHTDRGDRKLASSTWNPTTCVKVWQLHNSCSPVCTTTWDRHLHISSTSSSRVFGKALLSAALKSVPCNLCCCQKRNPSTNVSHWLPFPRCEMGSSVVLTGLQPPSSVSKTNPIFSSHQSRTNARMSLFQYLI